MRACCSRFRDRQWTPTAMKFLERSPSPAFFTDVSESRRRIMKTIRGRDTKTEIQVRRFLFGRGYRFRIHYRALPGCPDIVFTGRRKVIEVRGCFWHSHGCACDRGKPKTRSDYWATKLTRTHDRDCRNEMALKSLGWDLFVIWECALLNQREEVFAELLDFLGPPRHRIPFVGAS